MTWMWGILDKEGGQLLRMWTEEGNGEEDVGDGQLEMNRERKNLWMRKNCGSGGERKLEMDISEE